SIREHGIVHPLLVRSRDKRFSVVAGRRRLAAARILRLPAVPCLVHDLDDRQAAALASADNLTLASSRQVEHESPASAALHPPRSIRWSHSMSRRFKRAWVWSPPETRHWNGRSSI